MGGDSEMHFSPYLIILGIGLMVNAVKLSDVLKHSERFFA